MLSLPPAGEADEHVRRLVADRIQRREIVVAVEHLATGLDPVVVERRLHLRDRRPLDPEMRVAPVIGVLRVPAHMSAMPTPPVKPTLPSTTSSLRCVRLLSRRRLYQRSGR